MLITAGLASSMFVFANLYFHFSYTQKSNNEVSSQKLYPFSNRIVFANLRTMFPKKSILTTDNDGWRVPPWHQKHIPLTDNKKIFIFGGSTVYGWRVSDKATIPAFLDKAMAEDGYNVINFGQLGIAFHDEIILLEEQLKKNVVPDLVIFYHGNNEIGNLPQNILDENYKNFIPQTAHHRELNESYLYVTKNLYNFIFDINNYPFVKFITDKKHYQNELYLNELYRKGEYFHKSPTLDYLNRYLKDSVEHYSNNLNYVKKLSSAFGFRFFVIYQPNLAFLDNKAAILKPATHHNIRARKILFETMRKFYRELYRGFFESAKANEVDFIYRGDMFNLTYNFEDKVFLDYAHLNAKGNHYVASILKEDIKTFLVSDKIFSRYQKLTNDFQVPLWYKELY